MISSSLLVIKILLHLLGDGVFDKLNNQQVIDAAWDSAKKTFKQSNASIH